MYQGWWTVLLFAIAVLYTGDLVKGSQGSEYAGMISSLISDVAWSQPRASTILRALPNGDDMPSWMSEDQREYYEQAKHFAKMDMSKYTINDFFGGGAGGDTQSATDNSGFGGGSAQSGSSADVLGGLFGGQSTGASEGQAEDESMTVKKTLPNKRIDIPLTRVGSDYYGRVSVGTPAQQFTVLFDTGSPQFVLVSNADRGSYTSNKYDPSRSSTHKSQNSPIEQVYGSGSFQGHWAHDVVKLGDGGDALVLENQGFAEVTSSSNLFQDYDAIFGLSIIDKNVIRDQVDPPLIKMKNQFGTVPVFGVYIGKTDQDESKIVFGGNDEDLAVSAFNTHPLVLANENGKSFLYGWNVQLDRIEVGNAVVDVRSAPRANLDSGTTAIAGPADMIRDIQQKIFASWPSYDPTTFSFPCTQEMMYDVYLAFPDVTFVMSGQKYTLRPYDYMYLSGTDCKAGFVEVNVSEVIVGRMFLKKYYTKFDYMNKQVHIAKAKQTLSDEALDASLQQYQQMKG